MSDISTVMIYVEKGRKYSWIKMYNYKVYNNWTPNLNQPFARAMENLRWLPGTKIVLISSSLEDCYIFAIETQWFILTLFACYRGNTKWSYSVIKLTATQEHHFGATVECQ